MTQALPVADRSQAWRYARSLFRTHPGMFRATIGLHLLAALAGLAGPQSVSASWSRPSSGWRTPPS